MLVSCQWCKSACGFQWVLRWTFLLVNLRQSQRPQIFREHLWMCQFPHFRQAEVAALRSQSLIIDLKQDQAREAHDRRLMGKQGEHRGQM
jgi:hypothetical protein